MVAKRMMGGQGSSSLVGRIVDSVEAATTAAADGANLVLVTVSQEALKDRFYAFFLYHAYRTVWESGGGWG